MSIYAGLGVASWLANTITACFLRSQVCLVKEQNEEMKQTRASERASRHCRDWTVWSPSRIWRRACMCVQVRLGSAAALTSPTDSFIRSIFFQD